MPTLIEDVSPHNTLQAFVEEENGAIYFYLWGGEESQFGMRSCWVRNLAAAPQELSVADAESGKPPVLPARYCNHPKGAPRPRPEDLQIVWFEEGDAAALLENNEILAIIPSWSGIEGFHGYARDCIGESPLCWRIPAENVLPTRVRRAMEFWADWDKSPDPWQIAQKQVISATEKSIGQHEKYFAIDGGEWPPKALLQTRINGGVVLTTVGVCIRPQPAVEQYMEDPSEFRRIELGICVDEQTANEVGLDNIGAYISAQTNLPWTYFTWLGHGHTISCRTFPGFTAAFLSEEPVGGPALRLPPFRDETVKMLWIVPITEAEFQFAQNNGPEELLDRFVRPHWMHRKRQSLV